MNKQLPIIFSMVLMTLINQDANAQQATTVDITRLGDAPYRKTSEIVATEKQQLSARALQQFSVNRTDRQSVATAYLNDFLPLLDVPINWTGNVGECNAGQTDTAFLEATINAVNYFRAMVSLSPITNDSSLNASAQQAALMMAANKQLSHSPTTDWTCYTNTGATSASKSNLGLAYTSNASSVPTGAISIKRYITDFGDNNTKVGHRRWILYPKASTFGTGSVGPVATDYNGYQFNVYTNALDVISAERTSRPTSPTIVAWPPEGYVPQPLLAANIGADADAVRWSFSLNSETQADYSNATVSMIETTADNTAIDTTVIDRNSYGYGDSALVWETPNLTLKSGETDRTFSITVSGISNAAQNSYNYSVTVIDPNQASTVPIETSTYHVGGIISGLADGGSVTMTNGSETKNFTVNGEFNFDSTSADGSSYTVSVTTQPTGQTCNISNSSGNISGADVDNITVDCRNNDVTRYNVSGAWYDPAYNGSGFIMMQTPVGTSISYYGYKGGGNGNTQWLVSELIDGNALEKDRTYTVKMRSGYSGNGGTFSTKPNLPTPEGDGTQDWGTLSLRFDSCNQGYATLTDASRTDDNDGQVTMTLLPIYGINRVSCGESLTATPSFNVSGIWYDSSFNGSGFYMSETPVGLMSAFYGYKGTGNGEAFWLISDALSDSASVELNKPYTFVVRSGFIGNGGSFTIKPITADAGTKVWGKMELIFDSCNTGTLTLTDNDSSDGDDGFKTYSLSKLVGVEGLTCSE